MTDQDAKKKPAFGFLTVTEHPQYGLFGGYLVLNPSGRPLEFHCTAPIKPNRAQEILYGPTLNAFLYGEQIGQTLVQRASVSPAVIFTDREPALATREHVSMPVVLVLPPESDGNGGLTAFHLGRNCLALPETAVEDRRLTCQRMADLAESFDLAEPFERIRDAIEEAQQAVR